MEAERVRPEPGIHCDRRYPERYPKHTEAPRRSDSLRWQVLGGAVDGSNKVPLGILHPSEATRIHWAL